MNESDLIAVVGVFTSKSRAERARRALRDSGIPPERISTIAPRKNQPVDVHKEVEAARFSEEQLQLLAQEIEQGRALLVVDANRPVDGVIAILDEHDAIHVDLAEYVREETTHHTLPLYEEELRVSKETKPIGEIVIRKVVEEIQAQAEVEALHEDLDVEYVTVGQVVDERRGPWREGDTLVVPVYEEQLTVVRQLVMREQLRIKLHTVREKHTIADTVKREHAVVEDPDQTNRVNVTRRGSEAPANSEPIPAEQPEPYS